MFSTVNILLVSQCLALVVSNSKFVAENQTESSLNEMIKETCLLKTGFKALDNATFCRTLEVTVQETARLPCSFCGESTEDLPKIWMVKVFNSTIKEVDIDLSPNIDENRIVEYPNHTLVIHNVTFNDNGRYSCRGLQEDEFTEFQFNLDVVKSEIPFVAKSDKLKLKDYENNYIMKINEQLYTSKNESVEEVLSKLKIKVKSEWDPWLPCDGCTRVRRRYAKCRLQVSLNRLKYPDIIEDNLNEHQRMLYEAQTVSCHSLYLEHWFPALYSLTSTVPNFLDTQECVDSCAVSGSLAHEARYRLDLRMDFGASMSFACPESTFKSKVTWRKDGTTMKPIGPKKLDKKPKKESLLKRKNPFKKKADEFQLDRAFVDRTNVLQLCSVTFKESALYVCYVDKIAVKAFNITVISSEEMRKERFYHFWLLTLSSTIISSVIVLMTIAWACLTSSSFRKIMED